jgi:hypothetical protein
MQCAHSILLNYSLGILKKDEASTAVDGVGYAELHMSNIGITYLQLTCVITDTESMMTAAGSLFKEKSSQDGENISWHECTGHIIPDSIGTMSA